MFVCDSFKKFYWQSTDQLTEGSRCTRIVKVAFVTIIIITIDRRKNGDIWYGRITKIKNRDLEGELNNTSNYDDNRKNIAIKVKS